MDTTKKLSEQNPVKTSNFISKLFFWWLRGLIIKGYKTELQDEDLYQVLPEHEADLLGSKLETSWKYDLSKATEVNRKPSLLRVLFRMFLMEFLVLFPFSGLYVLVLTNVSPVLLGNVLEYFKKDSTMPKEEAYIYAGCLTLVLFSTSIVYHQISARFLLISLKIRVATASLIYKKVLRLSKSSQMEATTGQIVNLLTIDMSKLDRLISPMFAALLFAPLQFIVVVVLLWHYVGVTAFIALTIVLIQAVPMQFGGSRLMVIFRRRIAACSDERVGRMSEFIVGIRVIKMYAWEKPLIHLVELSRRKELKQVLNWVRLWTSFIAVTFAADQVTTFIALLSYSLLGNPLTADKVFVMLVYLRVTSRLTTNAVPRTMGIVLDALVSIRRVETFLLIEEVETETSLVETSQNEIWLDTSGMETLLNDGEVMIEDVTAQWSAETTILKRINLEVKQGELVAVTGEVGSGKSSLLHVILREISLTGGRTARGGTISYASQEPWIFNGTVSGNILFGQQHNAQRYDEVIRVCALRRDLELFPDGDATLVGDRGITLSGGQKARISLARAVYREADIYLLDDPFSAVDSQVRQQIWDACVIGFLASKTRIVVTHQLHLLHSVEHIVVLNSGEIKCEGSYNELLTTHSSFAQLINAYGESPVTSSLQLNHTPETIQSQQMGTVTDGSACVGKIPLAESRIFGKMSWGTYWQYIYAGGNVCYLLTIAMLMLLVAIVSSGQDYWISYWTNEEELLAANSITSTSFSTQTFIEIYAALLLITVITYLIMSWMYSSLCNTASSNLHDRMLARIARARMIFFETNTTGRILNRFSLDMSVMDEYVSNLGGLLIRLLLPVIGGLVLMIIVNYWISILVIIIAGLYYFIFQVYVATARDIKRLEGISQSPVIAHLIATLNGIVTIRASQAESNLIQQFGDHQNVNTSCKYLYITVADAITVYLDLCGCLFTAVITYSFMLFSQGEVSSTVGLVISQCMTLFPTMQIAFQQISELSNGMTSVERILEFTQVETEDQSGMSPSADWPSKGQIEFKDVSLQYDGHSVLENVSFLVKPQEKVGIVGRTGAGKSSLITALFRLVPHQGTILIDGLDTNLIRLEDLRRVMSIIPQDPILFSATLRHNLDPLNQYEDHVLWDVLEEVELKEAFPSLNYNIDELGGNLSVGQKQLVCLARAILRQNKIIVLDEATANVDHHTDMLIQRTIRRRFADCTILTVAHRINTVIDSDQLLVMDSGHILEQDHPYRLLQDFTYSYFQDMVQDTGPATAQQLILAAEQAYHRDSPTLNDE